MKRNKFYSFIGLIIVLFVFLQQSNTPNENDGFTSRVKIALREVGHQILNSDKDSTSLVLPVVAIETSKFRLSFEKNLSLKPGSLVSIIQESFRKVGLPEYYRVEVVQCSDGQVAYSYEMSALEESTLIPCASRVLYNGCYTIEVLFINNKSSFPIEKVVLYVLLFVFLSLILFFSFKKKRVSSHNNKNHAFEKLGRYKFYPKQNKLVKEAVEIALSQKECELLSIFIENPNTIIKRDELTKKVWEDKGVIVGRSLDTYISKLRKKLNEDDSVKLTNVHGVGYKLEITNV